MLSIRAKKTVNWWSDKENKQEKDERDSNPHGVYFWQNIPGVSETIYIIS